MSTERKFFGTDGVRGPYGGPVVNEAFFARLAYAAGQWVNGRASQNGPTRGDSPDSGVATDMKRKRVAIGCDTRASGGSLAEAVMAGLRLAKMRPTHLGVLPTPAVALAVKNEGISLGVVITASHNPAGDNGIKFFKQGGLKLSDEEEAQIEALIPETLEWEAELAARLAPKSSDEIQAQLKKMALFNREGVVKLSTVLRHMNGEDYVKTMARLLPTGALRGWHVVLDAANGAASAVSPTVLRCYEAEVLEIGSRSLGNTIGIANSIKSLPQFSSMPSGQLEAMLDALRAGRSDGQINDGCGSEHPEKMCAAVREHGARLGIAHDGDGDRCVLCDERGEVLDGDEILTILALHALRAGRLGADTLVVTVQSNLGVDAALAAAGGRVVRTPVGDRHVAEKMRELGATLGGESSGHIICADVSPTGDGLVAALRVMEVMRATGRPLSELRGWLKKFPQASATVAIAAGAPKPALQTMPALSAAIHALETALGARGRVLARWSGTEPKLRLLVEGPDEGTVQAGLGALAAAARADLGV